MASARSQTSSTSLDMLPRSTDQNHIIGHSGGNTLVSKVTEAPPKAPGEEETGAWSSVWLVVSTEGGFPGGEGGVLEVEPHSKPGGGTL